MNYYAYEARKGLWLSKIRGHSKFSIQPRCKRKKQRKSWNDVPISVHKYSQMYFQDDKQTKREWRSRGTGEHFGHLRFAKDIITIWESRGFARYTVAHSWQYSELNCRCKNEGVIERDLCSTVISNNIWLKQDEIHREHEKEVEKDV